MPDKPIACVHIPRFAVEAERKRRSDAASRLILIGDATVFDCSLGAETARVKRGIRMSEAIGLCTQALVLPPDIPYYERTFNAVLDTLGGFSPIVQAGGLGTAFLSLSGFQATPQVLADDLISGLHRRTGFMPSIGVAESKFAARVAASITPPGVSKAIPSGEEHDFLAPLPVDLLPTSEAMLWRLHLLGIETMGEITRTPLGAFQAQFGPEGKRCWDLATGHDDEPLVPRTTEETIVRRLQMPAPAVAIDAILIGAERLLRAAYADNGRTGRWVRKAILRGTLDSGGAWELPIAFREALANPDYAWVAVKAAVMRRPPERAIEEMEIELIGLSGESGKQASMFEGKGKLWRQIEESIKQLETQQEPASVGKVIRLEPWSRIPERRAALADYDR